MGSKKSSKNGKYGEGNDLELGKDFKTPVIINLAKNDEEVKKNCLCNCI